MRKHLVVALAGALSVTTVSAPAAHATHEIVVQSGDTMQTISEPAYGDGSHVLAVAQANHLAPTEQRLPSIHSVLPATGVATALPAGPSPRSRIAEGAPPAPPDPSDAPPTADSGPAPPAAIPLPILTGPASPDGAPAPGALPDALAAGPVIQSGLATWYGP
ncbi:MAG TPA: hypothetical protein VFD32_22525, partial [Dehalococcoidia bacterium]|nr:hypothetical protein [Dehalococcoidia bacterium]